jgi:hybrid cluster-associated redox disulfide protein
MKKKNEKVTKDTNLGELVQAHPEIAEVLYDYGLHCVGCPASGVDTLENGAKVHGLKDQEVEEMVARINEVIVYKE